MSGISPFPSTRTVLWNSTAMGPPVQLQMGQCALVVSPVAMQLLATHVQRVAKEDLSRTCFLVGTISEENGELLLRMNRFDPGKTLAGPVPQRVPTVTIPGDVAAPISIKLEQDGVTAECPWVPEGERFAKRCDSLYQIISSLDPVDLGKLVSLEAYCSGTDNVLLAWDAVVAATPMQATPVPPMPILHTALMRKLRSQHDGQLAAMLPPGRESGFLSMDATRKVVLICEDDTRALQRPLIGVWVSGVERVEDPYVWASCLRFSHADAIPDRALKPSLAFLVVLFLNNRPDPVFYECGIEPSALRLPPFRHATASRLLPPPGRSTQDTDVSAATGPADFVRLVAASPDSPAHQTFLQALAKPMPPPPTQPAPGLSEAGPAHSGPQQAALAAHLKKTIWGTTAATTSGSNNTTGHPIRDDEPNPAPSPAPAPTAGTYKPAIDPLMISMYSKTEPAADTQGYFPAAASGPQESPASTPPANNAVPSMLEQVCQENAKLVQLVQQLSTELSDMKQQLVEMIAAQQQQQSKHLEQSTAVPKSTEAGTPVAKQPALPTPPNSDPRQILAETVALYGTPVAGAVPQAVPVHFLHAQAAARSALLATATPPSKAPQLMATPPSSASPACMQQVPPSISIDCAASEHGPASPPASPIDLDRVDQKLSQLLGMPSPARGAAGADANSSQLEVSFNSSANSLAHDLSVSLSTPEPFAQPAAAPSPKDGRACALPFPASATSTPNASPRSGRRRPSPLTLLDAEDMLDPAAIAVNDGVLVPTPTRATPGTAPLEFRFERKGVWRAVQPDGAQGPVVQVYSPSAEPSPRPTSATASTANQENIAVQGPTPLPSDSFLEREADAITRMFRPQGPMLAQGSDFNTSFDANMSFDTRQYFKRYNLGGSGPAGMGGPSATPSKQTPLSKVAAAVTAQHQHQNQQPSDRILPSHGPAEPVLNIPKLRQLPKYL